MTRFKLLIVAAAVVLVAVLGISSASSAQESGSSSESKVEIEHSAEECIHLLEEGKSIDDCQAAPNQLLPATNELIYGGLAFLLVFGFLWKLGMPAIKTGMNARTERIRGDLDTAEAQREEATQILADYKAQLADARNESARIIEEARQAADEVKQTLTAKAQADIAELRTKATADIEAAKVQAIADLRGEVANLAIGAAEQVVERSLDRDTSVALVEAYINQVGADR